MKILRYSVILGCLFLSSTGVLWAQHVAVTPPTLLMCSENVQESLKVSMDKAGTMEISILNAEYMNNPTLEKSNIVQLVLFVIGPKVKGNLPIPDHLNVYESGDYEGRIYFVKIYNWFKNQQNPTISLVIPPNVINLGRDWVIKVRTQVLTEITDGAVEIQVEHITYDEKNPYAKIPLWALALSYLSREGKLKPPPEEEDSNRVMKSFVIENALHLWGNSPLIEEGRRRASGLPSISEETIDPPGPTMENPFNPENEEEQSSHYRFWLLSTFLAHCESGIPELEALLEYKNAMWEEAENEMSEFLKYYPEKSAEVDSVLKDLKYDVDKIKKFRDGMIIVRDNAMKELELLNE